ncbi:hypothetical protein IFM89_009889 [Coptis chinensis]|uniref:RRM domain-containing protein n=1 Tax=Coptis chinensis TaxID=261450 RepID=A0A835I1Y0_9MAGN|nr:hypothetical protein IFM89_009889 [Coptis chinensis]
MARAGRGRPAAASPSGSDTGSSSRSRSSSGSDSRSRSRSVSKSFSSSSSSPSRSASSASRSPPPKKSPSGVARRGRSPVVAKRASPAPRKASPLIESVVLHVDQLTRNVNEGHLKEIFGNFGEVVSVDLSIDRAVNLSRGYGYVEFKMRADAEKALQYMDGAQIDGNVIQARFTLPPRQKVVSDSKAVPVSLKREGPQKDNIGVDNEKDGPSSRQRDWVNLPRRGDSPPRRRMGSPIRRRSPPRRRPGSPIRRRSPSPPRRNRSPGRASPRRIRGSPVRARSPLPLRRRSPPRRVRSPRRSPVNRRRSRSPVRRPIHSRSRSISPRSRRRSLSPVRRSIQSHSRTISPHRGRAPVQRRGRSSSYSGSPSPPARNLSGENCFLLLVEQFYRLPGLAISSGFTFKWWLSLLHV